MARAHPPIKVACLSAQRASLGTPKLGLAVCSSPSPICLFLALRPPPPARARAEAPPTPRDVSMGLLPVCRQTLAALRAFLTPRAAPIGLPFSSHKPTHGPAGPDNATGRPSPAPRPLPACQHSCFRRADKLRARSGAAQGRFPPSQSVGLFRCFVPCFPSRTPLYTNRLHEYGAKCHEFFPKNGRSHNNREEPRPAILLP